MVKGLKRLKPFTSRQALPITPKVFLDMFKVMDVSSQLGCTLKCVFVLAYSLCTTRKSNMMSPSQARFDPKKHICRRDIFLAADQVLIYIKWTKTIQSGERYLLVPLAKIPGSPLCPYTAVKSMLEIVPAPPASPAFLVPSSSGLVSITHCSFTKFLRQILVQAGHNPQDISCHSFQCGGESFALSCGVPGELIKFHVDWKSQCYLLYF